MTSGARDIATSPLSKDFLEMPESTRTVGDLPWWGQYLILVPLAGREERFMTSKETSAATFPQQTSVGRKPMWNQLSEVHVGNDR